MEIFGAAASERLGLFTLASGRQLGFLFQEIYYTCSITLGTSVSTSVSKLFALVALW